MIQDCIGIYLSLITCRQANVSLEDHCERVELLNSDRIKAGGWKSEAYNLSHPYTLYATFNLGVGGTAPVQCDLALTDTNGCRGCIISLNYNEATIRGLFIDCLRSSWLAQLAASFLFSEMYDLALIAIENSAASFDLESLGMGECLFCVAHNWPSILHLNSADSTDGLIAISPSVFARLCHTAGVSSVDLARYFSFPK